jgi:hypothetical protein
VVVITCAPGRDVLYIRAMQLHGRAAIMGALFLGLVAGCSGKSNPSGTGAGGQGGGSAGAGGVSANGDAGPDATVPTCGETIDQYCQSDGSTCSAGVPRDWTTAQQQASSRCAQSHNVFFQQCVSHGADGSIDARYGVLNGGGVDDDTVFFYDLETSMLVRVDHIQFGGARECIAGVNLDPVDCSLDGGTPTYVCTASDAGAD